jgi:hypothetical protein
MGYGDYFDMAVPVEFRDSVSGIIDWNAFWEDLIGRLLGEHVGAYNGISTEELAHAYFKRTDHEACYMMGNIMQRVRYTLLKSAGVILKSTGERWHIVANGDEAMGYIKQRVMRELRAYRRTVAQYELAASNYPELAKHPLKDALTGAAKTFEKIDKARKTPLLKAGGESSE